MKDFVGQDLAVGDTVVYMQVGYRSLKTANVIKITPKMVILRRVGCSDPFYNVKQYHSQVVKVPKEI